MRLNSLTPAEGSKSARKRVGRGTGSGRGTTCGRGSKGQKSRSGGYTKVGFEGGQMPLQRRLPKRGFRSMRAKDTAEIRLHELARIADDVITLKSLRAAGLVRNDVKKAKIIASGTLDKAVKLRGLGVTKGARAAIETAGGEIQV